jgi:hypothetical protein
MVRGSIQHRLRIACSYHIVKSIVMFSKVCKLIVRHVRHAIPDSATFVTFLCLI